MTVSKSASAASPRGTRRKRTMASRAAALRLPCALLCCLAPAAAPAQVTVLRHVTVIDGNGGAPRRNASLVIQGDKISAINDASLPIPAGAKVLDLPGKTIMPEMVSAHTHLGLLRGPANAWEYFKQKKIIMKQLLQYQDYGVGAVLSMGTDQPEIWKWRAESRCGHAAGGNDFFGRKRLWTDLEGCRRLCPAPSRCVSAPPLPKRRARMCANSRRISRTW